MVANDTSIADTLRADQTRCKAYVSQASTTRTVSATATATSSSTQTATSTAKSDGQMLVAQNSAWYGLGVVVVGVVHWVL